MTFLMNNDFSEFYRPEIYISFIHKLKKKHIEFISSCYCYRFILPFDPFKANKRNLYFSLQGNQKLTTLYTKDFAKLESDFLNFNNEELTKPQYAFKIE